MVAPWDIYAKELLPLGYGHPLWGPEPSLETGEVRLGDVGYLRDGRFCFLLNALKPADSPVNATFGVPSGFHVFNPPNLMWKHRMNEITQHELHSRNIQSAALTVSASGGGAAVSAETGVRYRCNEESGALLMLRDAAHKTYLDCPVHIKKYMKHHLRSWHQFANGHLGVGIEEKDIVFVSGFVKTTVWAEAAFSHRSSEGELLVAGGAFLPTISAGGEFHVSLTRCVEPSVFSRSGPQNRLAIEHASASIDNPEPNQFDQCIFLNYYKMKSRTPWGPLEMRAAAGPRDFSPDSPDAPEPSMNELARVPSNALSDVSNTISVGGISAYSNAREESFDPVNVLLDYILKHSKATVAIASDMNLEQILRGRTLTEELPDMLDELLPVINVDDDGVGTIMTTEAQEEKPRNQLEKESFDEYHAEELNKRETAMMTLVNLSNRVARPFRDVARSFKKKSHTRDAKKPIEFLPAHAEIRL